MPTTTGKGTALADHESHHGASDISGTCTASRHGPTVGYRTSYGCTCPAAVAHYKRWQKAHRLRKARGQSLHIDATGTRRRVQALVAIGWTLEDLGARFGDVTAAAMSRLTRCDRVHVRTARRVAELYQQLADHQGPSQKSARRARTRGWLPPLWWDDDTIDDPSYSPSTREPARPCITDLDEVRVARAIVGQEVDLTRAERLEAVRQLHVGRLGYNDIAARLHLAQRQVHRDLTDLGLVARHRDLEEAAG